MSLRRMSARMAVGALTTLGALAIAGVPAAGAGTRHHGKAYHARTAAGKRHIAINCAESSICAEVANPREAFGNYYVGHDEPSVVFYSSTPGSGNRARYVITLPSDPSPSDPNTPGKSYNFQLHPTVWFGMALCDTQSYPEQIHTCTPDSDTNITTNLARHTGAAFTELQFYPPGWVPWPTWAVAPGATTCDPTRWCAAMNVFSLLEDPVAGTLQNESCLGKVGIEPFNFAFVTRNGKSLAPANPIDATLETYTPNLNKMLLMNSGDRIAVTMHDTPNGLFAELNDLTSGQKGSMTASPANGFAQIKFAPTGDSCTAIPYAFHPMYSTSSEKTRVPWAAHTYNVAFSDEIGHWDFCNGSAVPATPFGITDQGVPVSCPKGNTESDGEPAEDPGAGGDDNFCFPASRSLLVKLQGCTDTNTGFDAVSYHPVWPDGNTTLHPTPVQFTSPLTGRNYDKPYDRAGLEADLPRIEFNTCNRDTGEGCTLTPITDDNEPVAFYPYYSISAPPGQRCVWQLGGAIPGTTNNFGGVAGYGHLIAPKYLLFGGGGAIIHRFNDFRNVFSPNPCP